VSWYQFLLEKKSTDTTQCFELQDICKYQMVLQNKEEVVEQGAITLPEVSFWISKKKRR
jgi:hypothetical protein